MPHAVALSLAKNVAPPRSRAAVSAYGLRLPSSSSTSALSSLAMNMHQENANIGAMPMPPWSAVLASARVPRPGVRLACTDDLSMSGIDRDRMAHGQGTRAREQAQQQAWPGHGNGRKRAVNKTNPFIGYFQQSAAGKPSMRVTSCRVVGEPLGSLEQVAEVPSEERPSKQAAVDNQVDDQGGEMNSLAWLSGYDASRDGLGSPRSDTVDYAETTTTAQASTFSSSLQERRSRFEEDFDVVCSIGEGGQGTVFKVRSKLDGCEYAVKQVTLPKTMRRNSIMLQQALREVKAMASMPCHPHVVRYHTAWIEEVEDTNSSADSNAAKPGLPSMMQDDVSSTTDTPSFGNVVSIGSLGSYEGSMGGFVFDERSRSTNAGSDKEQTRTATQPHLAIVREDLREDDSVSSQSSHRDTTLVLFIQMELCRMPPSVPESEDSFLRLVDRIAQTPDASTKSSKRSTDHHAMVHPSFSSWLRGSVDARSCPETAAAKHQEGLKLFLGILDGVQHMHACGVIHRDLKPENVFLHGDVAKIGDFGLSKSMLSDANDVIRRAKTRFVVPMDEDHTTALGTFTYASPEQLGNGYEQDSPPSTHHVVKNAKYSFKSDIFALGVILLELCCPCKTMMERSQVLTAVRHGVVPPQTRQQYPVEMALVLRMTAIEPAERPSAEEVMEQLKPLVTSIEPMTIHSVLSDLRDVQQKLAIAALQLRDRSQSALQLEALVAELNDKVQILSHALA